MKFLVTGANGQLGTDVVRALQRRGYFDIVEVTRASHGDLTARGVVADLFHAEMPDVVFHCAAWTDVDGAERDPERAFLVNGVLPGDIAAQCRRTRAHMVHVSSDYVFDGTSASPYPELASCRPLNVYGISKVMGEDAVRGQFKNGLPWTIVRTSWLFGGTGPNFVTTIQERIRAGLPLRVVADQMGCPTWTGHLAPALVDIAEGGPSGVYHLSGGGQGTTWFEFAWEIAEYEGLDDPSGTMMSVTTAERMADVAASGGRSAPRPGYSVLDNRRWRQEGRIALPHWTDGLDRYLEELRSRAVRPVAASVAQGEPG